MDSRPAPVVLSFAKALADETRQELMRLCCCEWRSVGELAEAVGVTQPTVSHHLALLRDAGLVELRRQGRQTFYTLNQAQVAECCGRLVARYAPEVGLDELPLDADPDGEALGQSSSPMRTTVPVGRGTSPPLRHGERSGSPPEQAEGSAIVVRRSRSK